MNWYIGQDIVCIKSSDYIVKGKVYTIKSLRITKCKCGGVEIDVGATCRGYHGVYCDVCNHVSNIKFGDTIFEHESQFAPLDVDISELTEILELQND